MKSTNRTLCRKALNRQSGLTLLETVVALGLLLIASAGVMGLAAIALGTTESQGHLMARTAEYAQDKMEQLMALKYGDTTSNTAVMPTVNNGGTGLTVGGGSNPSAPVAGYVDYLDKDGNLVAGAAGGIYVRVWQISSANAANTLKQITVTVRANTKIGNTGRLPQSTVTSLKAFPF